MLAQLVQIVVEVKNFGVSAHMEAMDRQITKHEQSETESG